MWIIQRILLAALVAALSVPAYAGSPVIWGAGGQAKALNAGGITLRSGQTLSNDGPTNLIPNGGAEDPSLSGWATYEDAAAATPEDGTAGTIDAITAAAQDTDTADLISGRGTARLSKSAADAQGEGWSVNFSFPAKSALYSTLVSLSFNYYFNNTDLAADSIRVYVYDDDLDTLITPQFVTCGGGSTPALTITTTACKAELAWVSTTSDNYRLIFHVASTDADDADLYVDDLFVGDYKTAVGPAISEYESTSSYTIGSSGTPPTPGSDATYYRRTSREGGYARIRWEYQQTTNAGAANGTGSYTLPLPSGITIDTSRMRQAATNGQQAYLLSSGRLTTTSTTYWVQALYTSTTAVVLQLANDATNPSSWGLSLGGLASTAAVGFAVEAILPIAEWSGTQAIGENKVEYASVGGTWDADSTTTVFGAGGSLMGGALTTERAKTITWNSPAKYVQCWASRDGIAWGPLIGAALGSGSSVVAPQITAAGSFASGAGVKITSSGSTTTVSFARYMNMANDDAPVVDWPNSQAYWVCSNSTSGVPVGFGLASADGKPGLYTAGQTYGTNSTTAACTGCLGEYQTVARDRSSPQALSDTTAANLTASALTLTAGDWDVSASAFFDPAATTTFTQLSLAISRTSATLPSTTTAYGTANSDGEYTAIRTYAGPANGDTSIELPTYRISLSASTTFYLVGYADFATSTLGAGGAIYARRAR